MYVHCICSSVLTVAAATATAAAADDDAHYLLSAVGTVLHKYVLDVHFFSASEHFCHTNQCQQ
jgi:hypothetical protein